MVYKSLTLVIDLFMIQINIEASVIFCLRTYFPQEFVNSLLLTLLPPFLVKLYLRHDILQKQVIQCLPPAYDLNLQI